VTDAARSDRRYLPTGLRFGAGQVTVSVFFQVTSLLLLPFMTNVLAIQAALAATIIMLPKVASMVLDPLVGVASDRMPARWRDRRPLLLLGGILTALHFPLLFNPFEDMSSALAPGYMLAVLVTANLALSMLTVSYLASAADIASDARDRTVLTSWRVGFHMGGVLLGGLAPLLVQAFGGDRPAYTRMALLISTLCCAAVLWNYLFTLRTARPRPPTPPARFGDLAATLRHPSMYRTMVGIYGVKYLANGIQYAAMAYFVLFVLGGDLGLLSAMVVTMTALALASQPLWVRLAARIGELRTFQVATVGIGLAFLGYVLLQPGQFTAGFGLMAMQGVFAGGGALMSWSLFVGAVQRYTVERGEHRPELLSGVWSAVEKSAFAIGVFIFGLVLQWLGLVPSRSLDTLQPDSALTGIRLGMAVLPALGMLLTLVMIRRGLAPHDVDTRGSA
jgi:Na+/melibiose symporter-like transporter